MPLLPRTHRISALFARPNRQGLFTDKQPSNNGEDGHNGWTYRQSSAGILS